MALTPKVVEKLDELVERADYGGPDDDPLLASAISDYWPDIEPILRTVGERLVNVARGRQGTHRQ